ncbi:hypothetical protein ACFL6E_05335 [Candidatus Neomarinimicrobiota bacterium]
MKNAHIFISLFVLISMSTGCKSTAAPEKWDGQYQLNSISGCQHDNLTIGTIVDSCFVYQFDNDLVLDFCVTANCCPDSNRFEIAQEVRNDSITIIVSDIADDLCFCTCPYIIHSEFFDLPEDMYYVRVLMADGELVREEQIWRIF